MTTDAELNSEKARPEQSGGPDLDREAAAAGSESPTVEAAASPGEAPRAADAGEAKAEVAQPVEPDGKPSVGKGAEGGQAGAAHAVALPRAEPVSPLGEALAALDRRDYATAKRLFVALGRKDAAEAIDSALAALDRKDYATAQGLFEALKPSMPSAPAGIPTTSDARSEAEPKPVPPPLAVVSNDRRRQPPAETVKRRGSRLRLLAACLALLAIVGAAILYQSQKHGATLVAAKSQTAASLATASDSAAAPTKASAEPTGRGEAAVVTGGQSAALAQTADRLDRIERETAARFDALGDRADPSASAKLNDLTSRLDALEKKTVSAAPSVDLADLAARLDQLEKKVAAAPPPPQLSDLTTRLDKLEKKVAASVASAASAAKPPPPAAPKSSTAQGRAQPDAPRRLLQDYSVEAVEGGVAVVDGRYGSQQVAPGDIIPGAGRVLRIERQGRDWYVLTSGGVIAGASALYGAPF